jgi:hypothetical protein
MTSFFLEDGRVATRFADDYASRMGFFSWLSGTPKEQNIAAMLDEAEPEAAARQPSKDELVAELATLDEHQLKRVEATEERAGASTYTASGQATVVRSEDLGRVGTATRLKVRLYVEAGGDGWQTDFDVVCSDRVKAMIQPGATFPAVYDPRNRQDVDIRVPPP